jgi:hypothetical protein
MKNIVSVPFIQSTTPCANLPNLLAPDLFHTGLNYGSELRWQYERALPAMGWITDMAMGIEYEGAGNRVSWC